MTDSIFSSVDNYTIPLWTTYNKRVTIFASFSLPETLPRDLWMTIHNQVIWWRNKKGPVKKF